eukprot:3406376-Karenia_brevis.AAC.1
MHAYIAGKVTKVGGGHPSREAVRQLLSKMDADPSWYPGKKEGSTPGPASVISGTNQTVIAKSAMAMKARGVEPTYSQIIASNPRAAMNPETKKPVGKKRIYSILESSCYDDPDNPEDTW